MNAKAITIGVLGFAGGFLTHLLLARSLPDKPSREAEIERHWKLVNDWNSYMRDPENYKIDAGSGVMGAEVPYDHEPHLAALVALGELKHINLVLPLVPHSREATVHWMTFLNDRQDTIVYATGNPVGGDLQPSGNPPLFLNLWFKDSAKSDIQQLIRELEELSAIKRSSAGDDK